MRTPGTQAPPTKNWQQLFLAHFPYLYDEVAKNKNINWEIEFRKTCPKEYAGLDEKTILLLKYIKENDIKNLEKLDLNFKDLFRQDNHKINVLTWIRLKNNPDLYNLIYHLVILEKFTSTNNSTKRKFDKVGILFWAITLKQPLVQFNLLRSFGASIDQKYQPKIGPHYYLIHHAIDMDALDYVRALIDENPYLKNQLTGDLETPIIRAAKNGNINIVKYLISQRVNVNTQTSEGYTCLYYAALNGNAEIVDLLIQAGANPNIVIGSELKTLAHIAARVGDLKTLKILIKYNLALVEKPDKYNQTPLLIASKYGHHECVDFLIHMRANPNVKTVVPQLASAQERKSAGNNKTALHWAIWHNHPRVVVSLIKAGANINVYLPLESPLLPLHAAAKYGFLEIVKAFIETKPELLFNESRVFIKALDIAKTNERTQVVEYLRSRIINLTPSKEQASKFILKNLIRLTIVEMETLIANTETAHFMQSLFNPPDKFKDQNFIALDNMLNILTKAFGSIDSQEIDWDEIARLHASNKNLAPQAKIYFDVTEKIIAPFVSKNGPKNQR